MATNILPPQMSDGGYLKPKGIYSNFKQWQISPLSSNQYWTPDQIVRFQMNVTQGVMDPYRSHLRYTASINQQQMPVGGLWLSSSASTIISSMVISSKNRQIQRITQYDTLSSWLTDIGFSQYVCQSRTMQGLGYSNISSHMPMSITNPSASVIGGQGAKGPITQMGVSNTYNACRAKSLIGVSNINITTAGGGSYNTNDGIYATTGYTGSNASVTNPCWLPVYGAVNTHGWTTNVQAMQQRLGRLANVRAQYYSNILAKTYPDSTSSQIMVAPQVLNQTWTMSTFNKGGPGSGFQKNNPYAIAFQSAYNIYIQDTTTTPGNYFQSSVQNLTSILGMQKPITGQFSRGTLTPMISPTIPQCQMQNGVILPYKVPVANQTFRTPLISSVMGVLLPAEAFFLIPIACLKNILIQLTLSKFAFNTTGYCDVHEFDSYGMSYMQKRAYRLSQIYYVLHLYTFPNSRIQQIINTPLLQGISVSSRTYVLASQYQIPNGQMIRNLWPIGTLAQSINQLIVLFIPNDYMQYTFCDKQFRITNNISSMQIKFNAQWIPSQPITGNCGNPYLLDTTGTNWAFYQQLSLSNNFLFNTNFPQAKINPMNFSVNERCYNIANKNTYYDPNMLSNASYSWTKNSVNMDTALGNAYINQMRLVGKGAIIYSFQPYGHSKGYMNGLDASGIRDFSIQFNTTNEKPFPRDQTMYIWVCINTINQYTVGDINVLGY